MTITTPDTTSEALDVWLKFKICDECGDAGLLWNSDQTKEIPCPKIATGECEPGGVLTHEANTYKTKYGYVVEWYLNSVGLVTAVRFDTLAAAHAWYEREGFSDYSS